MALNRKTKRAIARASKTKGSGLYNATMKSHYYAGESIRRASRKRNSGILGIPAWAWIGIGVGAYLVWSYFADSSESSEVTQKESSTVTPEGVVTVAPTKPPAPLPISAPTTGARVKAAIESGTISPSILVNGAYQTGVQRVEGGPSLNTYQWNYVLNMLTGISGPPPSVDDATPIKAGAYLSKLNQWASS